MRFPQLHKFLVWAGPALLAAFGVTATAFATLAQAYPKVKKWGEDWFLWADPIMTAPWFLACLVLLVLGYVAALVWTGAQSPVAEAQRAYEIEKARQSAIADAEASRVWRDRDFFPQKGYLSQRREERMRQEVITQAEALRETQRSRRLQIAACRKLIAEYGLERAGNERTILTALPEYLALEAHFAPSVRTFLNGVTALNLGSGEFHKSGKMAAVLRELERLEKEWKL